MELRRNDRFTAGDTYDADGNTVSSGGIANGYDFENHLIQNAGVSIVYDGDGNRVSKTVAGVTTTYLVDSVNPTGYAQVVFETFSGSSSGNRELNHTYVYGLELISQTRSYVANFQSATQEIYYAYDGHGSVRSLTDPTGAVTDTYDYDAFGNLIHSSTTLSTPRLNNYLFAGEQFDPDLHLYYNRARYLNVSTGRFWSMDTDGGDDETPLSLHKYLYANADPIGGVDPSGHEDIAEVSAAEGIGETLDANIGNGVFGLGRGVQAAFEASKPVLAALGVFYGLLNPQSDFAGVTYDFQLAALTGGDFPDISFGVERRVQNFIKPQNFTIIRVSYRAAASSQTASVFRLKIGDDGSIGGSGGLNIKLYEKSIFFGKLTANLGFRVDSQLNLGAQFEFGLSGTGIAPGVDQSGPVSGLSPDPKSPSRVGIAIRSKKILFNLKAIGSRPELLADGISVGDDSPL